MNFSDDPFRPSAIIQGHEIVIAYKLLHKERLPVGMLAAQRANRIGSK